MPLDTIINGYFRSGTTIFWQIAAESNPDYAVFYEPCNMALFRKLKTNQLRRSCDPIHQMDLWDEYFRHDELIEKLRWSHPNLGQPFPADYPALERYAAVFHQLPVSVILQTNRWQFHLADLQGSFGCNLVHLIRNPIPVFRSLQQASQKNRSILRRSLRRLFNPVLQRRAFRMDTIFDAVWQRYGIPPREGNPVKRLRFFFNAFDQHFIVWTISNHAALKQIERTGGLLMCYEDAVRAPEAAKQRIEDHCDISFSLNQKLRRDPRAQFLSEPDRALLDSLAATYGLEAEWKYIRERVAACAL